MTIVILLEYSTMSTEDDAVVHINLQLNIEADHRRMVNWKNLQIRRKCWLMNFKL